MSSPWKCGTALLQNKVFDCQSYALSDYVLSGLLSKTCFVAGKVLWTLWFLLLVTSDSHFRTRACTALLIPASVRKHLAFISSKNSRPFAKPYPWSAAPPCSIHHWEAVNGTKFKLLYPCSGRAPCYRILGNYFLLQQFNSLGLVSGLQCLT